MRETNQNELFCFKNLLLKMSQNPFQNMNVSQIVGQAYKNSAHDLPEKVKGSEQQSCQLSGIQSNITRVSYELQIFYQLLTKVPSQFITLLTNDGIESETYSITLNNSSTITKIYKQMITQANKQINQNQKQAANDTVDFETKYINQTSLGLITQIINTYAKIIAECFTQGKQEINTWVHKIEQQIKTSHIMNTYIVFALLKQMARCTQKSISQMIATKFKKQSSMNVQQFCKYIQRNYQFLTLDYKKSGQNYIYTKQQQQIFYETENQKWLKIIQNSTQNAIKLKPIQSLEGDEGMLLQRNSIQLSINNEQTEKDKKQNNQPNTEKLIIKIEDGKHIKVINAKICQQSWKIFNNQNSIQQLYQILKSKIQEQDKIKNKQYVSYGVPTCGEATIGGSLGKCLANIDQYHNANQFLLAVSKTTAIYGTISIMMAEVPIISYLIIAGGFTYSFYVTFKNGATSKIKKAKLIGNATLTAVGSIGSTIGGILLGQALLPIPFLGAFVGGVLGGFFGTKGVKQINQFLYKSSFNNIIKYLKTNMIEDRYWKCSDDLLKQIGLDKNYFMTHTPSEQSSKDIYITAICFCIVTFYESKRYVEYNEQKMKQFEQKKKKQEQKSQAMANFEIQESDCTVQQQKQQPFVNQFDIVKIIDYLLKQDFIILTNMKDLQKFILHIVC